MISRRPAWQDHPLTFIEPFYRKYAARHPLCLVEWGVTRRSRAEGIDADLFAAARIEDLFSALKVRFPRLKMACAFDRDNLAVAREGRRLNDYSLPSGSLALQAYRLAASDSYFLTNVLSDASAPYAYQRLGGRLPPYDAGPVAVSLSTYALGDTLALTRGGRTLPPVTPLRFPPAAGPGAADGAGPGPRWPSRPGGGAALVADPAGEALPEAERARLRGGGRWHGDRLGGGRRGFGGFVQGRLRLRFHGRGGVAQDHQVGLALGGGGQGPDDTGLEQAQLLALLGQLVQQAHVVLLLALNVSWSWRLSCRSSVISLSAASKPLLQAGAGDGVLHH